MVVVVSVMVVVMVAVVMVVIVVLMVVMVVVVVVVSLQRSPTEHSGDQWVDNMRFVQCRMQATGLFFSPSIATCHAATRRLWWT